MRKRSASRLKIRDIAYIGASAALIAVCSWISVPSPVPFTLQTFAVFSAVGILGGRRGTIAVLVYLLLGAVGLPVFAGFRGGVGVLLGTTGGYIAGFLLAALLMWAAERLYRDSWFRLACAMQCVKAAWRTESDQLGSPARGCAFMYSSLRCSIDTCV